jgi:hypothetical protein
MIDLIQREETPTLPAIAVAIRVLRDVLSSEPGPERARRRLVGPQERWSIGWNSRSVAPV